MRHGRRRRSPAKADRNLRRAAPSETTLSRKWSSLSLGSSIAEAPPGRIRRQHDLWLVAAATLLCYLASSVFELHESYFAWLARYERWQADELPLCLTVLAGGLAWYAFRRRREAGLELQARRTAEARVAALLTHNRGLAQQLIGLQESERRALARELHDELGQSCSAIRVETAYIRRSRVDDRDGVLAAAGRADAAAQTLYALLRDLLRRLRPAHLDTLGLVAALQALCEAWEERSGVGCVFHHEGAFDALRDGLDITVYRITQEALTNVMRHANASAVRVRLSQRAADGLQLCIEDDGCGMDVQAATGGLGLLGAAERAAALGGTLRLHSAPDAGLRVSLHVPVAAAEPAP